MKNMSQTTANSNVSKPTEWTQNVDFSSFCNANLLSIRDIAEARMSAISIIPVLIILMNQSFLEIACSVRNGKLKDIALIFE